MNSINDLLDRLHDGGSYEYFWSIDRVDNKKRTQWNRVGERPDVPDDITADVYFGVHPTASIPTTSASGHPADPEFLRARTGIIDAVNCVFAEFDAKDFPGGKAAALAHVNAIPEPPTVLIDSGGGYHAYWILSTGVFLESDEQRQDAADLQRAWVQYTGGDDGAKDLARVLRVPGTINHKYPHAPIVEMLTSDGPTYSEAAIRNACDDVLQALLDNRSALAEDIYTPETPEATKLADALTYIPAQGGYDQWLHVLMGIHSAFPGPDGITIAEHWSPGFPGEIERKWKSFSVNGNGGTPITVASVFALAQDYGWSQGLVYSTIREDVIEAIKRPPTRQPVDKMFGEFDLFALGIEPSDGGIADLWVHLRGDDHVYVRGDNKWHRWNGKYWEAVDDYAIRAELSRLMVAMGKWARSAAQAFRAQVERGGEDAAVAAAMLKRANAYQAATKRTKTRITSVFDIAINTQWIAKNDMDSGDLLNLENGTLDLTTLAMHPHNRKDMLSYALDYAYDPNATAPRWLSFVDEVIVNAKDNDSDPWTTDIQATLALQEAVGYTLTTDVSREKTIWLSGQGGNGKSVVMSVLSGLMGNLATTVDFHRIGQSGNYDDSKIPGRRLVFSTESAKGGTMADEYLKAVISGDDVSARPIYGSPFTFKPVAKVWWAMNNRPRIKDTTNAMFRRIMLFEFHRTFGPPEMAAQDPWVAVRDPALKDALLAELPGILNWAIEGLVRLRAQKEFTYSASVESAIKEYKESNDVVGAFLDEMTGGISDENWTSAKTIYENYTDWCNVYGYKAYNVANFAAELKRFPAIHKRRTKVGIQYNFWVKASLSRVKASF